MSSAAAIHDDCVKSWRTLPELNVADVGSVDTRYLSKPLLTHQRIKSSLNRRTRRPNSAARAWLESDRALLSAPPDDWNS